MLLYSYMMGRALKDDLYDQRDCLLLRTWHIANLRQPSLKRMFLEINFVLGVSFACDLVVRRAFDTDEIKGTASDAHSQRNLCFQTRFDLGLT